MGSICSGKEADSSSHLIFNAGIGNVRGMGGQVVKRAFKYRFYPSEEQEDEFLRTFGCVRLVYNKALEARRAAWYSEQRRVNYVQTSALLTAWKKTRTLLS